MNGDTIEFDKLLHNYDYENQKCLKTIEKENQLNEGIRKDNELIEASIAQLQSTISEMDESAKRVHKQFTINRDRCKSLKSTSAFLTEHSTTLAKKLEAIMSTCKHDESENQKIMDHYQKIWEDYDAKYHSFPFVKMLETKVKEFSLMEAHLVEQEEKKQKLFPNDSLQDSNQLKELQKFIVALSQLKLDSTKKQEHISLLETQIQQKNIEKQQEANATITVDSSLKEADLNKENIQPDICLASEEPQLPEKMEPQNQNKLIHDYESLKVSSNFESKMNVPSQHRNSSDTYGGNSLISKTSEKTDDQALHPDNVFKQPARNYAENQRNATCNATISLPPSLNLINTVAPESRTMPTIRTNVGEPTVTLPAPVARSTERPNFTIPVVQPPLMPNMMFNQSSPAKCNQQNIHESANQTMAKPSASVDNSANVQAAQPLNRAANQVPKVVTSSLQFSSTPIQTPLSASDCNFTSSTLTLTSSLPASSLPASQEITHTPPVNYKGDYTVPLDGGKLFDLNEHQTFIKKFNFSPGAPSYTQRPMFELTEGKSKTEEVDDKKKLENPFFLQSFFTEKNDIPQNKENPDSFKAPATTVSPFIDPFSGFNQNSGNENTACTLDFEFNNSAGETSTTENFFSFNSNTDFFQTNDSAGGFSFNFDSTTNSDNDNAFSLF